MKPVSILEGIAKRKGCAVFRVDGSDKVVEVAGLVATKPESVLGLKVVEKVPYPIDAQIFKNLLSKTRATGKAAIMTLPVYHQGTVYDLRICIGRNGPDCLLISVLNSIHIRSET